MEIVYETRPVVKFLFDHLELNGAIKILADLIRELKSVNENELFLHYTPTQDGRYEDITISTADLIKTYKNLCSIYDAVEIKSGGKY